MAHVAAWKKDAVEALKETLNAYPVIGIVDVGKIPAQQMQQMRAGLRGKAHLKVVRKNLLNLALDGISAEKKDIIQLRDETGAQIALIGTDMNPFKLYKTLNATKTKAPAKGGEIAPEDVVVSKGETDFKPGPILGELQQAGIPAAIEKGKVVIKSDKVMVKAGEPIPAKVAQGLTKLDIKPLTVGLNLLAAYEEGFVYGPSTLAIDEAAVLGQFADGATKAFNLAVFAAYPTADTIEALLQKSAMESRNLMLEAAIPVPGHIEELLAKAHAMAYALTAPAPSEAPAADAAGSASGAEPQQQDDTEEEKSEEDAAAGLGALFD